MTYQPMPSTPDARARVLPPVNHAGGALLPPPDFMGQVAARVRAHFDDGLTKTAIASLYNLAPADVFKVVNGRAPRYSPRIVERVLNVHTQEVRLVVRLAPDEPALPDVVYLDLRGGIETAPVGTAYTLREVADLAGCAVRTVQRYVKMGSLPVVELVPGQPPSHRVARVMDADAQAWIAWYRTSRKREGQNE